MSVSWKSCARWPKSANLAIENNISTDKHDTREQAEAVCRLLRQNGFGGDKQIFPEEVWVEEIEPDWIPYQPRRERDKEFYDIMFEDGTVVKCCYPNGEHWNPMHPTERYAGAPIHDKFVTHIRRCESPEEIEDRNPRRQTGAGPVAIMGAVAAAICGSAGPLFLTNAFQSYQSHKEWEDSQLNPDELAARKKAEAEIIQKAELKRQRKAAKKLRDAKKESHHGRTI